MWKVVGAPTNAQWLSFEPIKILYDFDIPRVFTCQDNKGNLYLAYLCAEDALGVRYLVVPAEDDLALALVQGRISLRDALTENRAWVFDLDNSWEPVQAWCVDIDDLPLDALPRPGAMLYSHLTPTITSQKARAFTNEIEIVVSYPTGHQIQWGVMAHA